jgi:basic membrane protein A
VEAPEDFTVRLVTDIGKVDDRTFNQYAYEGMKAAEDCFGFETSFIETVSEADYAKNIATTLEGGPDVVITVGFLLATDTLAAANANAGTNFIGIDQFQADFPENYVGVLFNEDEGGYLAGVLAASLSETGTIGVVGGREDVPPVVKLVNGYKAGAESVNPDINVLSVYNESFNDPAKGESDADQFIGEGADVIFGAGGKTGSAGVQKAAQSGIWGIGVDQDEYFSTFQEGAAPGAEHLASSAVKRVDLGVFTEIVAILDGTFEGGIFALTAANGGITYAPFHDADIPDDVAATLEETRKGLADGTIKTGLDPVTGLPAE